MEAGKEEWEARMLKLIAMMREAADHLQEEVEGHGRGCKCYYENGDRTDCAAWDNLFYEMVCMEGLEDHCCKEQAMSSDGCTCDKCDELEEFQDQVKLN